MRRYILCETTMNMTVLFFFISTKDLHIFKVVGEMISVVL